MTCWFMTCRDSIFVRLFPTLNFILEKIRSTEASVGVTSRNAVAIVASLGNSCKAAPPLQEVISGEILCLHWQWWSNCESLELEVDAVANVSLPCTGTEMYLQSQIFRYTMSCTCSPSVWCVLTKSLVRKQSERTSSH